MFFDHKCFLNTLAIVKKKSYIYIGFKKYPKIKIYFLIPAKKNSLARERKKMERSKQAI